MDYNKLKELTKFHSVAGDSSEVVDFIENEIKSAGANYVRSNNNTIVAGNLEHPRIIFSAHFDEVGFQITEILENGTLKFLPVGWVFPNRMNHQTVYIRTDKGRQTGIVLPNLELKAENVPDFNDLYISFGMDSKIEIEKLGIKPGQTGTFTKEFYETETSIISSALDNKVAVRILLDIAQKSPEILKDIAIAFVSDEEMEDHSANGLGYKYSPDMAVVLDYCPVHQNRGLGDVMPYETGKPIVMYRGGSYIIHEKVRRFFEDKIKTGFTKGFLSSNTLPVLEPSNFENNGHTVAVNICVPAQGYHGESYLIRKDDIIGLEVLVRSICN